MVLPPGELSGVIPDAIALLLYSERLVFLAICHHIYSVIIMNVLICGK